MEKRRVVVTGLGTVNPLGKTVEEYFNGVSEEENEDEEEKDGGAE